MKQVDGEKLLASLGPGVNDLKGRLTPDAPMDRVTWFQAGGPAEVLFLPADPEDLADFLRQLPQGVPVTALLAPMIPALNALGHANVQARPPMFKANAIEVRDGRLLGGVDPRSEGQAVSE